MGVWKSVAITLLSVVSLYVGATLAFYVCARKFVRKQRRQFPKWFDPTLRELARSKSRDSCSYTVYFRQHIGALCFPGFGLRLHDFYDWSDVESTIRDVDWEKRDGAWWTGNTSTIESYRPDTIVGIKSGGAFIANYVAQQFQPRPRVEYIRVKHYSGRNAGIAQLTLRALRSTHDVRQSDAEVTEPLPTGFSLEGQRVLLVDDQCMSGASLRVAKMHLEERGAKEVRSFCMFARLGAPVDIVANPGSVMVVSPWGLDA